MEAILKNNIFKNEGTLIKREYVFAVLIFSLLLFLSFSIFFKNTAVSQYAAEKKFLLIFKDLKQEYHALEVAYIQKIGLLNKDKALEFGFVETKNVKFASRDGVLVRADSDIPQ